MEAQQVKTTTFTQIRILITIADRWMTRLQYMANSVSFKEKFFCLFGIIQQSNI